MTWTSKPVKGHALRGLEHGTLTYWRGSTKCRSWVAICECGDAGSALKVSEARSWHRKHKATVLEAQDNGEKSS